MTTYKLPENLVGIEVREAGRRGDGRLILVPADPALVDLDWEFCLPEVDLVEVVPPLPPEPDVPAVSLGGRVWARAGTAGDYHWVAEGFHGRSWLAMNQLSQGVPIVPLVPDPVAFAPELPFEVKDFDLDYARVSVHEGKVAVSAPTSAHLYPEDAEQFAAAILRASREARKAGGES